jgi:hypothetical protein
VRDDLSAILERGAFFFARSPIPGPLPGGGLEQALSYRWRMREISAQVAFLVIAFGLLLAMAAAGYLTEAEGDDTGFFSQTVFEPGFIGLVIAFAQGISAPLSTLIFPAIDIADLTPGRRIAQLIGRSGAVTTAVGLVLKGLWPG